MINHENNAKRISIAAIVQIVALAALTVPLTGFRINVTGSFLTGIASQGAWAITYIQTLLATM